MNPWMSSKQIDLIKSYLLSNYIMLEYGAGGSTLFFSKFVDKYISIEHDASWIEKIKNNLIEPSNIQIHHCATNNPIQLPVWQGSEEDFKNYINYVDEIQYKKYDAVLIDGRARLYCAKKILNYIDDQSIVFFHDFFERPRYHDVLKYYKIIDQDNENPSLVVLKKI